MPLSVFFFELIGVITPVIHLFSAIYRGYNLSYKQWLFAKPLGFFYKWNN